MSSGLLSVERVFAVLFSVGPKGLTTMVFCIIHAEDHLLVSLLYAMTAQLLHILLKNLGVHVLLVVGGLVAAVGLPYFRLTNPPFFATCMDNDISPPPPIILAKDSHTIRKPCL